MKVLIVGAGVAGLTCANLLLRQGVAPLLIERESEEQFNTSGYMLGLLPLGGRVFNELGLRDAYFGRSIEMKSYNVHSENGDIIRSYPLDFINEEYGSYRGISRTALVRLLLDDFPADQVRFDTTVTRISRRENGVTVEFSDGNSRDFDLVIIADGLHSHTRKLLLDESEYSYKGTGWGGWVTWLDEEPEPAYDEYWGAGSFVGLYPVQNHIGVFLGGPLDTIQDRGLKAFSADVLGTLSREHDLPRQAVQAFQEGDEFFFWQFQDCRSDIWCKGNVILLGDAATGFLPTAGVGASMAMDSASALVDELSRADVNHIAYALLLYARRQKERVERAQEDSRRFGRFMFVQNGLLAGIRNSMVARYSLQRMLGGLSKVIAGK